VAAAVLSEGPYGVRSAVDHRRYQRMLYAVLEHDPPHDDLTAFWGRLKTALAERAWTRQGITTEGAARSPEPIRTGLGAGAPQRCPFHVLQELTHGVLRAVATERARLPKATPTLKRGRPSSQEKAARRLARPRKQRPEQISALFQERVLLVKRRLQPSERQQCLHLTRGWPQWRQLRESMEPISAWCDRRCRPPTALDTLPKLRQWGHRFQWSGATLPKVFAPTLEKALTFLDDKLVPAPSKAVERGNRRHRKMPKRVDRVRSQVC
jgi:hypothetical protein